MQNPNPATEQLQSKVNMNHVLSQNVDYGGNGAFTPNVLSHVVSQQNAAVTDREHGGTSNSTRPNGGE